jgi:transcriptional regulator with XRE-family HTH domain
VDDLRAAFGQRLRALREKAGLSQEQLAERADLHWTYISGMERGRRNPGLNTLGRLARALNLSIEELLTGVEDHTRPASTPKRRRS